MSTTPAAPATPKRSLSLSVKIFLGTAAVVVVTLGVTLAITAYSANRTANESVTRVLASAREALTLQLDGRAEAMQRAADVFAGNSNFRDVVQSQNSSDHLDQAIVAAEQTGAAWAQIVNDQAVRLAKSDDPAAPADTLASSPAFGAALEGRDVSAFGASGDTMLVQLAVVPIADRRVYGALMIAENVDAAFAEHVKQAAFGQTEVIFYVLDVADRPILTGGTFADRATMEMVLETLVAHTTDDTSDVRLETDIAGTTYVALGGLLHSAGGAPVGGFVLARNRDVELAAFAALERTILYAGALGLLLAALTSLLMARVITRPVAKLAEATRRASDGDYNAEITASSQDEIGALAGAFRRLLADLREKQQIVEFLSNAEQARTVQMPVSQVTRPSIVASGLVPGSTFANRYEVKEVLGQGGMGTVFRAVDRELDEVIAIKTLKADFLEQDPTALDRFRAEIKLARRISHRNVVRTHDIGESGGQYFITMEFVEGKSLRDLIKARWRLPVPITLSIGKQLARALEIAHEQGVIHRDIKPHNMVLQADGVLKVMDFGIARLAERPQESGVTKAGAVIGTPEYMAPEQMSAGALDARADLYAAGCVLYECLSGKPPISAETPYEMIVKLIEEVPVGVRVVNPDVPVELEALIAQLLAKDPADRVQTATLLHTRLERIG